MFSKHLTPILLVLLVLGLWAIPAQSQAQILIYDYTPEHNDRTVDDDDFVAAGQDLSGVGRQYWVTMISPTHFLTAAHQSGSGSVTFFYDNPGTSSSTRTVDVLSLTPIAGSDLQLGRLAPLDPGDPIPPPYAIYPILDMPTFGDYMNLDLLVLGQTPATDPLGIRVGRNNIDGFGIETIGGSTGVVYYFDYDEVTDEAVIQAGDSGGPSFTLVNGQLALVGIHWAFGDDGGIPPTQLGADTFVPFYIAELQAALAASGTGETLTLVSIPEPSTFALLGLAVGAGAMGFVRRNRRRREAQRAAA